MSKTFTLANRNIKEILREPLSLIFTLALPLFMEILFYLLFHGLTSQFEMKYLAPGIVVFSQAFLTLFTGLLLSTDKNTSFLTRLYVSDAKSYEFIFGYALSVIPIALIQSVLFFLVGGIIDASLFGIGMLSAILLSSFLTSLFFIACGILFGSVCGEKSIGGISSIVIVGQSVLSGMWFPIEGLSEGMLFFMKVLPFRNATQLIQNTLNGIADLFDDFIYPLLTVSVYILVAFFCAILVFKIKMKSK